MKHSLFVPFDNAAYWSSKRQAESWHSSIKNKYKTVIVKEATLKLKRS